MGVKKFPNKQAWGGGCPMGQNIMEFFLSHLSLILYMFILNVHMCSNYQVQMSQQYLSCQSIKCQLGELTYDEETNTLARSRSLSTTFCKRFGPPIPLTDTDGIVNYELRRKFPKYPLVGYHRPWQGCISPAQNILLKLRPCNLFWPAKRAFWKGWRRKCLGTPIAGWV